MNEHERYERWAGLDPRRSAGDSQMIDTYDDAPESQDCNLIDGLIIICQGAGINDMDLSLSFI
jgi:hypothetical protein